MAEFSGNVEPQRAIENQLTGMFSENKETCDYYQAEGFRLSKSYYQIFGQMMLCCF